ncbi:hypothetical protein ISS03_01870 [Patescibacteria group bacterium]|nr:hypothetical protein [Patescibacteria group bacterium]
MKAFEPKDIFAPASDLPIVTGFLDMDFYKFTMGQFIFMDPKLRDVEVTFGLTIRTKDVRLAKIIDINELKEHLDSARKLSMKPAELAFLRGIPMTTRRTMFFEEYITFLSGLNLPDYNLEYEGDDIYLSFSGP